MKLSVIIPAHNEEGCIAQTVTSLYKALSEEHIEHEILVVNDNSSDNTTNILSDLKKEIPTLCEVVNPPPNGFGLAIRRGLKEFTGDAVAIYMADASDLPEDLVRFYRTMVSTNSDCVFGTRWSQGGKTQGYPFFKLIINRWANLFIQLIFGIRYNDTTNAFKLYRRQVIEGLSPLLSHHFNLTIELPLKAIVRGYTYKVVPNQWINRTSGVSKLKIKEMGSRYLFILLYCLIERWLSRGDYRRVVPPTEDAGNDGIRLVNKPRFSS